MKLSLSIIFAAAFLTLGGCATKHPNQPDWINGDSDKYKSSQYLIGRGQAASTEDAKDRARADLSKIFQVAIAADSDDTQSFKSDSTIAGGAGQYSSETSRRISTRTDQIIRGIQIAEIFQDPVSKTQHVLAVLPRLQAAASLRQQINQLDDATQASVDQSKNNTDLFIKIAAASKAIDTQMEREGLQKALQVVDITGRGLESKYNSARLKVDLDALLKRVRIAVKVLDGSAAGFEDVVAGAVSKAGFLIETGEKPEFLLKASLSLTDLGLKDGWYWQRGNLEISLSDVATGRIRGTQRWPIKSNATDKETALRRALDDANTVLKKELGKAIVGMAISQ